MGPTLIFDKSFLESLNPDEAVWLDNFFLCNITPLFYIETLADLEKEVRKGRTPEEVVGSLAYKTPERGKPNVHHRTLLEGELSGSGELDMKYGRPHIGGGRTVELGGKTGVIFQASPEEEAMDRWQNHEFLNLERQQAKMWRQSLLTINLEEDYIFFQKFFPVAKPKKLVDVKRVVDFYISDPDQEAVLDFGLILEGVTAKFRDEILARWKSNGKPGIAEFLPYFSYVLSVDLFFYLAIAADLIGRGRPSHKVDMAYLYYLPFCKVFTSNDKLHQEITPFFLRDNQTFVLGTELKNDLSKLDKHFDSFPEEIKKRGVMCFAHYPPHDDSFLTTRLWNSYMSKSWKNLGMPSPQPDSKLGKKLMDEIRSLEKEGVLTDPLKKSDKADSLIIKRNVRARKGKWDLFPPEVLRRRKNENGEWEDTP